MKLAIQKSSQIVNMTNSLVTEGFQKNQFYMRHPVISTGENTFTFPIPESIHQRVNSKSWPTLKS